MPFLVIIIILAIFSIFCYAAFSSYEDEEFRLTIVNIWKSKVLNLLGKIIITIFSIPWVILEFGIVFVILLFTYHPYKTEDDSSED